MFSFRSVLCCASLFIFTVFADVPISTQAILTTVYLPGDVTTSSSTIFSNIPITSTVYDVSTITTTGADGVATPVPTTVGSSLSVGSFVSTIVTGIPVTAYNPSVSTIGETTIYGPDTTADPAAPAAGTTTTEAPAAAASSSDTSKARGSTLISSTRKSSSSTKAASTNFAISTDSSTSSVSPAAASSGADASSGHSKGLSTGAKAAIGTAVVIIVIFLAILFFWLDQLRRKRRSFVAKHGEKVESVSDIDGFFSPEIDEIPSKPKAGSASSTHKSVPKEVEGSPLREKRQPTYPENVAELSAEPVRPEKPLGPSYRNSHQPFPNTHDISGSLTALPPPPQRMMNG